jgi:antitoxin Phd
LYDGVHPMFDMDFTGLFDKMLEEMQRPGQREAMQKAFEATPEELGKAAVEAAKKKQ